MATLTAITQTVGWLAYPLDELLPDYDPLFPRVGDTRFVLPGEALRGPRAIALELVRAARRSRSTGAPGRARRTSRRGTYHAAPDSPTATGVDVIRACAR